MFQGKDTQKMGNNHTWPQRKNLITLDEYDTPSNNIHPKGRTTITFTQEVMIPSMDTISAIKTPGNLAYRNFTLNILYEFLDAAIKIEAVELLEYRYLKKNPMYQDAWGFYFGNWMVRLFQLMKGRVDKTNTISFITKY